MDKLLLSNGVEIPMIGYGPGGAGYSPKYKQRPTNKIMSFFDRAYSKFIIRPKIYSQYVSSVASAIRNGFRLIDYSAAYGDGSLICKGIEKSGIQRDKLILTTRVSNHAQFTDTVEDEFFKQLKNLKIDYIDILMFHWPVTNHWQNTWVTMIDLQKRGYVKTLGVANCNIHHLKELIDIEGIVPVINQFEIHPLFTQKELINFCYSHKIAVQAYTPIARFDDRLVRLPLLKRLGEKYKKTIVQIVLRWHIQNGVIPVVRTLTSNHQKENLDIFNFSLTDDEVSAIDNLNINSRLRYDPDNCDFTVL